VISIASVGHGDGRELRASSGAERVFEEVPVLVADMSAQVLALRQPTFSGTEKYLPSVPVPNASAMKSRCSYRVLASSSARRAEVLRPDELRHLVGDAHRLFTRVTAYRLASLEGETLVGTT